MSRLITLLLLVLSGACVRASEPGLNAEDVLDWGGAVTFEESDEVVNVFPRLRVDPLGGFLVADAREAQLRRYSAEGALQWHSGRKGGAPGEYQSPQVLVRLADERLLVADWAGRVTILDAGGQVPLNTFNTPFFNIQNVLVVSDSAVLVSALLNDAREGPRLHLWNPDEGRVLASFFSPLEKAANRDLGVVVGWTEIATRGDTIAAVYAHVDTVFFFGMDGKELGSAAVPVDDFRPPPRRAPVFSTPQNFAKFMSDFDLVNSIHWVADGSLLVQLQRYLPDGSFKSRFRLVRMTRDGEMLWHVRDLPRLRTLDESSGELLFTSPDAEVPNTWLRASLR